MLHLLFSAAGWVVVILIPLMGAWVASSLAAYMNGPVWATALAGLLLFPVLPLAWEGWAHRRRERQEDPPPERMLTLGDRLIVRTLVLNLAFLGVLLYSYPQLGFTALSSRGDWMLDGREDPRSEQAREVLFTAADGLEWLHSLARHNPYEELADVDESDTPPPRPQVEDDTAELDPEPDPEPESTPEPDASPTASPGTSPSAAASPSPTASATPSPKPSTARAGMLSWPLPAEPDPLAKAIPESAQGSVADVAEHVKRRVADPVKRFKALHDFVALRTAYDAVALHEGRYLPQDPDTVLRTRLAVCAGYANLLKALGKAADLEVAVVTGDSRNMGGDIAGGGHAWNAVKLRGRWHLVDATWNAGYVEGTQFVARYGTEYLFTPAKVFVVDHLPDADDWQLLARPVSRGEFTRQPLLRPGFYAAGLELLSPRRSQVSVRLESTLKLNNPDGVFLLAELRVKGAKDGPRLPIRAEGKTVTIDCKLPQSGTYQVHFFVGEQQDGHYRFAGQLELHGG